MDNNAIKPHIVRRKDRTTHVYVDEGDKTILKVYKSLFKCTMTGTLHILLGVGARCFEEKHDQEIRRLNKIMRIQARIIVAYIEKYGQLRKKG